MSGREEEAIPAEIRRYLVEEFGELRPSHKLMARYNPRMLEGFAHFRRAILPGKRDAPTALPKHVLEIIAAVIEVTLGKGGDRPGTTHTRHAIRAGATPQMIHEAMSLVFFLAGMTSYVSYGIECVRAAEEEAAKLARVSA